MSRKQPISSSQQVINAVCAVTGADATKLNIRSRKDPLPHARHLICWFLRNSGREMFMTQKKISELFGWAGHREVIYAIKKIDDLLSVDSRVRKEVEKIKEMLLTSDT